LTAESCHKLKLARTSRNVNVTGPQVLTKVLTAAAKRPRMFGMAKPQAKIGDIVQLASGGPQMTIISIKGGQTECSWFDKEQKQRRAHFPEKALMPVPGEKMSDEQLMALAQRGSRKSSKRKIVNAPSVTELGKK
jgi:uncharacterized protein YodC (DUF2158 family)